MTGAETLRTETRTAKADAMEFLRAALVGDSVPAAELSRVAHERGLTPKAIRSAREALGVEIARNGFGPGSRSLWSLPGGHMEAPPSDEKVGANQEGPNMSETHRPKTIDSYEVIGVEPNAACEYCGQRGDDPVYLMQALFKGVGREPLHEDCAGYWFEFYSRINKRRSQV